MSSKQFWLGALVILSLTLAAHFRGLSGDFVEADDNSHITKNPVIRELTLANVETMFGTSIAKLYCPVTWLSFAVDHAIWGQNPYGYHLMNLLLHLANTLLVLILLYQLTDNLPAALLAAAIFGVHPLRVESVTWATERKDVLFCFFYLAGLLAYQRWVVGAASPPRSVPPTSSACGGDAAPTGDSPATTGGNRYYWCCFGLFVLSILSKSTAVTFPVVLLLLDYFVYHRLALKEKIPFFIGSLIVGLVTALSQAHGTGDTVLPASVLPFSARLGLVGYCSLFYVRKFFWPFHLCAIYPPFDEMGWNLPHTIGWLLALAIVSGIIFALRRRAPMLLTCWLFYLITLSPTIGLIPVGAHVVADRFSYLPLIGLALPFSVVITIMLRRWWPLTGVIVVGLAFLTDQRTAVWNNTEALYKSILAEEPNSYPALVNLADYYNRSNQIEKATKLGEQAVAIAPAGLVGRVRLARSYMKVGRYKDAVQTLRPAIEHGIDDYFVWKQLHECFVALHDDPGAAYTTEKMNHAPRDED